MKLFTDRPYLSKVAQLTIIDLLTPEYQKHTSVLIIYNK